MKTSEFAEQAKISGFYDCSDVAEEKKRLFFSPWTPGVIGFVDSPFRRFIIESVDGKSRAASRFLSEI